MGDILFDWVVTKQPNSNEWTARRDDSVVKACSYEGLREAVRDELDRDNPNEHLVKVLHAIKALRNAANEEVVDTYEALLHAVSNASTYLMRHHYPVD